MGEHEACPKCGQVCGDRAECTDNQVEQLVAHLRDDLPQVGVEPPEQE